VISIFYIFIRLKIKERFQPFPLLITIEAVGALTLHTGVLKPHIVNFGHKKCPQFVGELSRLYV